MGGFIIAFCSRPSGPYRKFVGGVNRVYSVAGKSRLRGRGAFVEGIVADSASESEPGSPALERVLVVHNRYLIRGGEDESRETKDALLRAKGHAVEEYVLDNRSVASVSRLRVGLRTTWSVETYREIRAVIRRFRPDIVDVHNFFPLISPSIYYAAAAEGVPVVQVLSNYRLACLNGYFYRDNAVCEDCLHKAVPWPGVVHGCYQGSRWASGALAAMLVTHRLLRTWQRMVPAFIVLTEFARRKFIEAGLSPEKLHLKPNFVPDAGIGSGSGGYALFVGRLSPEKGIDVLLDAWWQGGLPPLRIIGDGPLTGQVQEATRSISGVEYLGRRPLADVLDIMGNAAMTVVPSVWYETFGRTVVESYSKGTPVIASDIGAVGSIVRDGITGFHFRPGDAAHLRERVQSLWRAPLESVAALRQAARLEYESKYTPEINYVLLRAIYARAREAMNATGRRRFS